MTDELDAMILRIRRFDQRLQLEFDAGNVPGLIHLQIGQEAAPAGLCAALRSGDQVTSTHRLHGHAIARALPLVPIMPSTPSDARSRQCSSPNTATRTTTRRMLRAEWDAGRRRAAIVRRPGSDVTLVAASRMTGVTLATAERLSGDGVDAEVIDLRKVSPLDLETVLASVRRTGAVAVIDEGHTRWRSARDLAAQIAEAAWSSLRAAPAVVAAPDEHVRFSPPLARRFPPDIERVATIGRALAQRR